MQVQIPINNVNNGMAMMSPPSGSYNDMTQSLEMAPQHGNEDNRMYNNDMRKFAKNMKPAVLLKSWQRICMLVAGIEAVQSCGNVGVAALEKEIYDRYHGNMHRDPPIIGAVKRAMDDQLDLLPYDHFGIKFPREKLSYVQMTASIPGHIIWRYYKELVAEITGRLNIAYRSCLLEDFSMPSGKGLYDVLEDTLRVLWEDNEDTRKERAARRLNLNGSSYLSDSDGEPDNVLNALDGHNHGQFSSSKKRPTNTNNAVAASLFVHKPFPGVGKFQPISFLAFILLGPPAGDKCIPSLALNAHMEPTPRPRPSQATANRPPMRMLENEDMNLDDLISPARKRPRKEHHGGMLGEDDNEAIRIFNAETTARAQRLEELKLALSLFPDDENIKAELKQFVDTQRRTSLSADTSHHAPLQYNPASMSLGGMPGMSGMSSGNMAGMPGSNMGNSMVGNPMGSSMPGSSMQSSSMQSSSMQGSNMQGNAMQGNAMQGNAMQGNALQGSNMQSSMQASNMQSNGMQSGNMQANSMQSNGMQANSMQQANMSNMPPNMYC